MSLQRIFTLKRIALAVGAALALCLAVWLYVQSAEARLLRLAPSAIEADPGLVKMGAFFGRPVFTGHCASCHGGDAKGDARTGAPDLTDADSIFTTASVGDIEQIVLYGIRAPNSKTKNLASMPAYGRAVPYAAYKVEPLTPAQIDDVVEYLTFMQGKPADRTAVGRGALLYNGANVGGCYDCHTPDAKGDDFIGAPNLTDNVTVYGDGSKKALAESIALGRAGVCPAWISKLSFKAIRDVSIYLYALSHKAPAKQAAHG